MNPVYVHLAGLTISSRVHTHYQSTAKHIVIFKSTKWNTVAALETDCKKLVA